MYCIQKMEGAKIAQKVKTAKISVIRKQSCLLLLQINIGWFSPNQ